MTRYDHWAKRMAEIAHFLTGVRVKVRWVQSESIAGSAYNCNGERWIDLNEALPIMFIPETFMHELGHHMLGHVDGTALNELPDPDAPVSRDQLATWLANYPQDPQAGQLKLLQEEFQQFEVEANEWARCALIVYQGSVGLPMLTALDWGFSD